MVVVEVEIDGIYAAEVEIQKRLCNLRTKIETEMKKWKLGFN